LKQEKDNDIDRMVREKLISKGVSELTNSELLSVVLGKGNKGESALSLAEKLLSQNKNSLTEISLQPVSKLRMFAGIGIGRAVQVATALELAKRRQLEETVNVEHVNSKDDVVVYFKPKLAELHYEEFWALYLGPTNRVLDRIKISQGGVASTIVDNRLIIKRAIDKLASSIIIVHNHPSGNCSPSESDKTITMRLAQAASFFDIDLIDHIIITSGECFSFKGEGLL